MLTILSLFDYSGAWCRAFERLGCSVIQCDLKHGDDILGWSARSLLAGLLQAFPVIDGVLGAPPCTAFALSGAHCWAAKDVDGRTAAAVELVRQTLRMAVENPRGRIQRLVPELGEPALTFDPCDYAGWSTSADDARALDVLRAGEVAAADLELVQRTGAYTKRTLLWGRFAPPLRRPIAPVRCSPQGSLTQRHGGSGGGETRAARSMTPTGFAEAFARAQVEASPSRLRSIAARPRVQLGLDLGGASR